MKFNSLLEEAGSETDCSQVFIHFDATAQSFAMIVSLIEQFEGDITGIEIIPSDEPDHKIAHVKLANEEIRDIVIGLSENGFFEVQGISRRASR